MKKVLFIVLVFLLFGLITWNFLGKSKGFPFVGKRARWSIGIYMGDSPLDIAPVQTIENPVLTAEHITDIPARFVADPFMTEEDATWYMFFEILNEKSDQGDIGLATSSDGSNWNYMKVVLDEPFHLSYPYVFKWQDKYYMIPESTESNSIRSYEAVNFPTEWSFVETLLIGNYADPSIFQYADKWWIFAETNPQGNNFLRLYYADTLMGPWIEHSKSPIVVGNANIARPGGRVLIFDNRIYRYTQDDYPTYGNQVRAFEITELTTTSYEEEQVGERPILQASGIGWNGNGMHHIDPHQIAENKWIAVVDGYEEELIFGLGY